MRILGVEADAGGILGGIQLPHRRHAAVPPTGASGRVEGDGRNVRVTIEGAVGRVDAHLGEGAQLARASTCLAAHQQEHGVEDHSKARGLHGNLPRELPRAGGHEGVTRGGGRSDVVDSVERVQAVVQVARAQDRDDHPRDEMEGLEREDEVDNLVLRGTRGKGAAR